MPDPPDTSRRKHPLLSYSANSNHTPAARGDVNGAIDGNDTLSADTLNNAAGAPGANPRGGYIELRCKTNFSFLRGASHPEEMVEQAAALGYTALGVADLNSLAGVVRAHCAAKAHTLKLLIGSEITPDDGPPITLYAMNRAGYGRLARLITTGRMRAAKGDCCIRVADIATHAADLLGIVHAVDESGAIYREAFDDRLYWSAACHRGTADAAHLAAVRNLAARHHVPLVAVNDVHYHVPERRFLQDALTCVRHGVRLDEAGTRLFPNGERYLKSATAMTALFHTCPDAVRRTQEVADRCNFVLDELRYEYPPELCPPGMTPHEHLTRLAWEGAQSRYEGNIPAKVRNLIDHELKLIAQLQYEHYFLTVWDLVRFARSRGILCQGRGSAANSVVCFCLGVTSVDPARIDLLFERFVSAERNEPPDIDVDFEHERREEVIQYIYEKYGRHRAGIAAEVITYRPKSAVRDMGKTLGLSLDRIDALTKRIDWWSELTQVDEFLKDIGLDPNDYTIRCLVGLCRQLLGFPRHLSQHVGGFVITASALCEIAPIENAAMPDRTFIEWDKDDIDALGILKVDCLSLGMLTAIRKAFDLVVAAGDEWALAYFENRDATERLANVPAEDPSVYDMACHADTVGVFQIESRAQMSMLPRLRPRRFYDLVIEVAIVRPGPIQGGMVHPYLRRRNGEEEVSYPSDEVRDVLEKTLGVPLFQEQAMRLAVVAARFTPGEADQLRRSMAAWRRSGQMETFRDKLIQGMVGNGYPEEFAVQIFNQLRGFGEYGFPESHAASFALLVYVSCWLKRYYPAAFAAAVINSQPMGFYAPAQLVRDAREHGVTVYGVDINHSDYDCTLAMADGRPPRKGKLLPASAARWERARPPSRWGEDGPALRLGLRLVKGVGSNPIEKLIAGRADGPYRSIRDIVRRSSVSRAVLARLAAADAFRSLGLDRRRALWDVLALEEDEELPLFADLDPTEPAAPLPEASLNEEIVDDYTTTGLSLKAHPMSLVREQLQSTGVLTSAELKQTKNGQWVTVAGVVLIRQRPSTALGVVFMTLEDETGTANIAIRPKAYDRFRPTVRTATVLIASGRIVRQGEVVSVEVHKVESLATQLPARSRDFH